MPARLKTFMLALAIFDDVEGVVLIGLFYGGEIAWYPLAIAALAAGALASLSWLRVARPAPFVILGSVLWAAMLKSGIPAALAGIVIAFTVPLRGRDGGRTPLRAAERALRPWVWYAIVPVFVFFNAGIAPDGFDAAALIAPVSLGIALGLLVGKPLGIGAAAWLAVRMRAGALPEGVSWPQLWAGGSVAGIGFTVSLYITALAFRDAQLINAAKLAVVAGSLVSSLAGAVALAAIPRRASGA